MGEIWGGEPRGAIRRGWRWLGCMGCLVAQNYLQARVQAQQPVLLATRKLAEWQKVTAVVIAPGRDQEMTEQ